uniref:Uncharacterized protein n=1 Tax=Anguilla anguilla TaxID=7936 RepID=A0A0E9XDD1_ANGAN
MHTFKMHTCILNYLQNEVMEWQMCNYFCCFIAEMLHLSLNKQL